jgi:hypothetical protein
VLRHVATTRYVTPLREGGSMPAIVEGDDLGLYVLKFRGAGQGAKALVAELVAGRIAQALGLPVPELVYADLDPELARTEPDPEIQHLIRESAGLNLALDYLPGAANFDPVAGLPDAPLASRIVWFDSFVSNVDRTARNPNLMVWHRALWLIDHGAALYFHHGWDTQAPDPASAFVRVREHVLLPAATCIAEADADLAPRLDRALFERVLAEVPDAWLGDGADALRARYVDYLSARLERRAAFVEEARRARG